MSTGMMVLDRQLTDEEVQRILDDITRREFIIGTAALGAMLVGCSPSKEPSSGSSIGPWVFTDDRGEKVSLPAQPSRFAAFSTAAAALAEFGLTPDAIFGWSDPSTDDQLRYMDLTDVATVGTVYAELNMEKLLAVDPDLTVGMLDPLDGSLMDFKNAKQVREVSDIAPMVAVDSGVPLLDQIASWRKLAVSLGADPDAATIRQERDRFETASEALKAAIAANPGLKVMAVAPQPDAMNVVGPDTETDLSYYASLGMEFVQPDVDQFGVDTLSYENLDKYPADVILVDGRVAADKFTSQLEAIPTWKLLPAVQAGQVGDWHIFDPPGYRFYSEAMEQLTPLIERSQIVT